MKAFNKLLMMSTVLISLAVSACGGAQSKESKPNGGSSTPAPVEEPSGPAVFVLTGQSNMEGQSSWNNDYLKNAMQALEASGNYDNVSSDDYSVLTGDGLENVRTSYMGAGYDQIYSPNQVHASNKETPINGKFENTKVGMGYNDNSIGPELGCAYGLSKALEDDQKVYFIKCGISGSGFAQSSSNGDKINWNVSKEENLYLGILKPYVENCLKLIEEEAEEKPVIRGFMWMQGESDSYEGKIDTYAGYMNALLDLFKEDFEEYAYDEDRENIAFIDACVYDKTSRWPKAQDINAVKMANAEAHDNYYCINTTWNIEGGLELDTGSPGGNGDAHYNTESMLKLGLAFADVILENNLLD